MVLSGTAAKTKILNKIFSKPPATDITITPVSETVVGSEGGFNGTQKIEGTVVTTIGVPYGYVSGDRRYNNFGLSAEGETRIAIKPSETIKQGDKITFTTSDKDFEVLTINEYPYNNERLCHILTIKELL